MARDLANKPHESKRILFSRAFRPLAYWILISLFLLAWDFHSKNAPRTSLNLTVRIEGEEIKNPSNYQAVLRKYRVGPGLIAPVGWGTLNVSIPDAEPQEKRVFVWYGTNEGGEFNLLWKKGVLDLTSQPRAKSVRLEGPHHHLSLTNLQKKTIEIPVGTYRATATFEHLTKDYRITVTQNQTNEFLIRPELGWLDISTEPQVAKFELKSSGEIPLLIRGDVPALLTGIPQGLYTLQVSRGEYTQRELVNVTKWNTNQAHITFDYREVTFNSQPEGAMITKLGWI